MIIILRLLGFVFLISLSSCYLSLPQSEQRQNILPPPNIDNSLSQSIDTPFFTPGNWPNPCWWETFNAPDLNALIAEALTCNPSIKEVEARINFARQEVVINRSRFFPLVFFDAQDTWEHLSKNGLYKALNPNIPTNVSLIDLTLSFRYEFDFWGKNLNLFQAALGRSFAQEAERAQVSLITTTALAQAYFALQTNLAKRALYSDLFLLRKSLYDLTLHMKKSALYSVVEPLDAKMKLLESEQFLADIESEIATNTHLINILAGKTPDRPLCLVETLPLFPDALELPCNLSIDLLARRPDLMAQIWRAKAFAHETGAAIADFYPDVNLMGFFGLESVSYRRLFRSSSTQFGIQGALHLPIFTAGAIMANVRAKKAEFDEAIFAYDTLLLRSAQEVVDLLALAKAVFQKKIEQEEIVVTAEKKQEIISLRRTSGLDSLFKDYDSREEVIFRQLDDVNLLYNKYLAVIKLIKALGGGYSADCVPLRSRCV